MKTVTEKLIAGAKIDGKFVEPGKRVSVPLDVAEDLVRSGAMAPTAVDLKKAPVVDFSDKKKK